MPKRQTLALGAVAALAAVIGCGIASGARTVTRWPAARAGHLDRATTLYLGLGADALALKRAGLIGSRAGYENDTFLSNEAPVLTTWPEKTTERDFFRPKRLLPRLPGSGYRVVQGLTSGIVLAIRLIGIQARPTIALFRPFVPWDAKVVSTQGTKTPLCRGWVLSSASLSATVTALGTAQKIVPPPTAVYLHAWWTAPTKVASGSAYLDLRTTPGPVRC